VDLVTGGFRAIGTHMTLKEFPQLRDLPVREKLELVEEIWKDVAQELDEMEVSTEEGRLLDSRWAAFADGSSSALTTDEFMKRLAARRG
jgi:putative addiction module component (TIGR02574 family)